MYVPTEIIILFFLISFLIYTMPMVLVKFSKTLKGKFLLLLLTIVMTLYNRTGGVLLAMLIIFLSEFNYEVNNGILYEGMETQPASAPPASAPIVVPNPLTGPAMPLTASGEPAVPQPAQAKGPAQAAVAQAKTQAAAPMPGPSSLTGPVPKKDQLAIEAQLKPINTSAPPPT